MKPMTKDINAHQCIEDEVVVWVQLCQDHKQASSRHSVRYHIQNTTKFGAYDSIIQAVRNISIYTLVRDSNVQ